MKTVTIRNTEIRFDPDKHRYYANGDNCYGTSSISDQDAENGWRIPWAGNMCKAQAERELTDVIEGRIELDELTLPDILKRIRGAPWKKSTEAIDFGNAGHGFCEKFVLWKLGEGKKPQLPKNDDLKNAVMPFIEWDKENNPEYLASEEIVYWTNGDIDYAGTLDLRFRINGKQAIGDFKTAKSIHKAEYVAQIGLYAMALEYSLQEKIDSLWLFRLPKIPGDQSEVLTFPYTDKLKDHCKSLVYQRDFRAKLKEWLKK